MRNPREIVAAILGGAMVIGLVAYGVTHRERFLPPTPATVTAEAPSSGLTIPTVDEMCKALGATEDDALKQCQDEENAAGEFVVAWMALNDFIVDGQISLEQIETLANLGDYTTADGLAADPILGGDSGISADPALLGDPGAAPPQITAGLDPITGEPLGYFQSPAQLALFCLNMSGDWVTLHDCISQNDPSTHVGGP